ncbi:uncharacterized protein LOC127831607 [Dreissena polymorpha]|uniref:uncharacterized protein LOC127831607 n=1 Tax=Dreissena polymorpha TaxID=45954 RepID=UPI002264DC3A|nr:uncharacterized protein LOC127831607 [Dreissena polymorpha]
MTSIDAAFTERGTGPYTLALKVKVVAVKPAEVYRKDGEEKRVMNFAMSDGITTAKGICYDPAKFCKLQVGNTLVVRNSIRRTEDEVRVLILTSTSKVLMSAPLQVPPQHVQEGERLLNPPPAEIVAIKTALTSPAKKRVSISGKVTQEDEPREVQVQGGMVPIKTITVMDDSSKTQVTLWRDAVQSDVRPGDHVTITDVIVNSYQNVLSLSTTARSKIQMTSIDAAFTERGTGPYTLALKVKVVAVKPAEVYRKDGEEKRVMNFAMSDGITTAKGICYDPAKFCKLQVGNTLVVRNSIRRTEDEVRVLILTSTSKVLMSAPLQVPPQHVQEGERLLNPPPAEIVAIKTALTSPAKKRVSISGKVTQEDEPREVQVQGGMVPIKTSTVMDDSSKTQVTLWRDAVQSDVRPGDHVTITDVIVNSYQNVLSLSTTARSKIQKTEAPLVQSIVTVEAIGVSDGVAECFCNNGEIVNMPAELLQQALEEDGLVMPDIEMATATAPIDLQLVSKGSEVVSVIKL